jgi:hypothetical protein
MHLAKINPSAVINVQETAFKSTQVELDYICALLRPYVLGVKQVQVEVLYGNIERDENNLIVKFEKKLSSEIILEEADLIGWGDDDKVLLNTIATKIGTSVVEVEDLV